jgi:hypothetical protein
MESYDIQININVSANSEQEAEDNWNKIFKKNYEYELNKSTGEVEKRFINGISKPNESQFDGDKPNAVKP